MRFVSYSTLTKHRGCPQAWSYSSLRQLEEIPSPAGRIHADFGKWWHMIRAQDAANRSLTRFKREVHMPEKFDGPDGWDLPTEGTSRKALFQHMAAWWRSLKAEDRVEWENTIGANPVRRLIYMDEEWRARWADDLKHEETLAVEYRFEARVSGDLALVGVIDQIFLDNRRGMVVVRDFKTGTNINREDAVDDLMDSQLHLYGWAASPFVENFGLMVRAVGYDRARSLAPKEPKLTLAGNLSKQVTDFDERTYREWVGEDGVEFPGLKKDGSGAGRYLLDEKVIAELRSVAKRSTWFDRTLAPLNRNVIEAHLMAAEDTGKAMSATAERVKNGDPAPRNFTRACKWCEFNQLCAAELVGGAGEYDLEDFNLQKKKRRWR